MDEQGTLGPCLRLIVIQSSTLLKQKCIDVVQGVSCHFGRSSDTTYPHYIQLSDILVSRRDHACIFALDSSKSRKRLEERDTGGIISKEVGPELLEGYLVDMGSKNGTFLNRERLTESHPVKLNHYDRIQIGNNVFEVHVKLPIHQDTHSLCTRCEVVALAPPLNVNQSMDIDKKEIRHIDDDEVELEDKIYHTGTYHQKVTRLSTSKNVESFLLPDYLLPKPHCPAIIDKSQNVNFAGNDNIGFKLLQKLGWKEGSGLGLGENGIVEPILPLVKNDRLGIGATKDTKKTK